MMGSLTASENVSGSSSVFSWNTSSAGQQLSVYERPEKVLPTGRTVVAGREVGRDGDVGLVAKVLERTGRQDGFRSIGGAEDDLGLAGGGLAVGVPDVERGTCGHGRPAGRVEDMRRMRFTLCEVALGRLGRMTLLNGHVDPGGIVVVLVRHIVRVLLDEELVRPRGEVGGVRDPDVARRAEADERDRGREDGDGRGRVAQDEPDGRGGRFLDKMTSAF